MATYKKSMRPKDNYAGNESSHALPGTQQDNVVEQTLPEASYLPGQEPETSTKFPFRSTKP